MKRMKTNYEHRNQTFLTRRTPVIMRIDGKAFHTYTRGLQKPFDVGLIEDMNNTAIYLCQQIQGSKIAFVQSDEISILITDYDRLETNAWFDYSVQKMTSIAASLATAKFNQLRLSRHLSEIWDTDADNETILNLFSNNIDKLPTANFDCRVFNIPKEEIANYFLARQKDTVKNSIASVAQSLYSHKELEGKNGNEQQEMIFQKGINWNDFPSGHKRGRTVVKQTYVNGELFPPEDNSVFEENGSYFKISPIVSGEVMTHFQLENPEIISKWELVETPLNFTDIYFKKWQ